MNVLKNAASLLIASKLATKRGKSKKPNCLDLTIPAITMGISLNRARLRETEYDNKRDTIRTRTTQTSAL